MYELVYGFTPFRGAKRDQTFDNILKRKLEFPSKPDVSPACRVILSGLPNVLEKVCRFFIHQYCYPVEAQSSVESLSLGCGWKRGVGGICALKHLMPCALSSSVVRMMEVGAPNPPLLHVVCALMLGVLLAAGHHHAAAAAGSGESAGP